MFISHGVSKFQANRKSNIKTVPWESFYGVLVLNKWILMILSHFICSTCILLNKWILIILLHLIYSACTFISLLLLQKKLITYASIVMCYCIETLAIFRSKQVCPWKNLTINIMLLKLFHAFCIILTHIEISQLSYLRTQMICLCMSYNNAKTLKI